jgi:hypothetical protein
LLERLPAFVDEVVIVDGHSIDDTIAVARGIAGLGHADGGFWGEREAAGHDQGPTVPTASR